MGAVKPDLCAGKGEKIISLTPLSLPRYGTHAFAYRVVFEHTASHQSVAIDSMKIARGRIEVEIDQVMPAPSAADLANMKAGDRYIASKLDAQLRALG
ncbi:MAG TPA: hypothetical protein VGP69_03140 [Gaiellaceae bacterium]|nr:hypothetical protein [Gaiellaceae bacterium]